MGFGLLRPNFVGLELRGHMRNHIVDAASLGVQLVSLMLCKNFSCQPFCFDSMVMVSA